MLIFFYRVIVLDKGEIREFDTPASLLSDKNSIFYGMAKDAGLVWWYIYIYGNITWQETLYLYM